MSDILWRRFRYFLSPQHDIYRSIAPRLAGKMVLEVGFGTGMGTVLFQPQARRVIAIDTDSHAVEFAQLVLPFRNVRWLHQDILRVKQGPAIFEAAVMIEVLEHIADWRRAVETVSALVAPGGAVYVSARNANADLRRNELHEREWTADEFKKALAEYFADVKLYDYSLVQEQDGATRVTPIVAVAQKG